MSSTTGDAISAAVTLPSRGTIQGWALRQIGQRLRCGTLTVVTPDQARATYRGAAPGPEATLVLHRWRTLRRLLVNGDVGFAEAYMDGDWSSPSPPRCSNWRRAMPRRCRRRSTARRSRG